MKQLRVEAKELRAEVRRTRAGVRRWRTEARQSRADVRRLRADLQGLRTEARDRRVEIKSLRATVKDHEKYCIRDTYRAERPENLERFGVRYRTDIMRHELSRQRVLEELATHGSLSFLDAGGRDGSLRGLVGGELSRELFDSKVDYTGLDIKSEEEGVLVGDLCQGDLLDTFSQFVGAFDVVYSYNTFEHLRNPFVAMRNLHGLTKPGGIVITIAPFAWRYHAVPGDYFRYTHDGMVALLEENGIHDFEVLDAGFDIQERRKNRQGMGERNGFFQNDICPVDEFGAWREHWFCVLIYRKTSA